MSALSPEKINEIIRDRLKRAIEEDSESRLDQPRRPREDAEEASWLAEDTATEMQTALAENDYQSWAHLVDRIAADAGVTLEGEDYRRFYREVLKSHVRLAEIVAHREMGNYHEADKKAEDILREYSTSATIGDQAPPMTPGLTKQAELAPLVSEAFEKYRAENISGGVWTEKTAEELGTSIQLFIDVMGDMSLDAITRRTVVEYKDILTKLPANMKKDPRYRDKSIQEIRAMDGVKPMAPLTINKQIGRISALFNWACLNDYMQTNPADKLKVKRGKQAQDAREPFTTDDLNRIFHSPEYLEDSFTKSYQFWTPVIGLFTGCRLDEICQLHLEDIRMENGVWVLDINDGPVRKLKNTSSRRLVPLHPFLADDVDLLGFAERLRGQGEKRLFPELSKGRDGYGKNVSTWFRKWREKIGVDKPFHSFRHTFITHLKHKMVNPVMLQEVAGHTVDSMTFGTYGKEFPVDTVYKELILKIDYGVDLSCLKDSRYVIRE